MNPFDLNPAPWTSHYDADSSEWVISDADGNEMFVGSAHFVNKDTVNRLIKAVNAYMDR